MIMNNDAIQIVIMIFLILYIIRPMYAVIFLIVCIFINIIISFTCKYMNAKHKDPLSKVSLKVTTIDEKTPVTTQSSKSNTPSKKTASPPQTTPLLLRYRVVHRLLLPKLHLYSLRPIRTKEEEFTKVAEPLVKPGSSAFINKDIFSRNSKTPFKRFTTPLKTDIRQQAF